ncbi:MAG: beta-N-acetylhexosaminidase [Bacteroidales bacterium]|jgi:hexosaminidase|nr:beta-N-acetylhexosaminidase [Bacteroidales bacterium]
MQTIRKSFFLALAVLFLAACTPENTTDLTQTSFIPQPLNVTYTGDAFTLSSSTVISYQTGVEDLEQIAVYLAARLKDISGLDISLESAESTPSRGIYLEVGGDDAGPVDEAYEMNIEKKLITITGASPAGCFYGLQTLLQTIPARVDAGEVLKIATGTVSDYPEYAYRGAMLDVARHFFSVEDVKRMIDFLAMYKMNALHLHLSDDQGWRIEIKSWPGLTEIGGSTEVGGGKGGFFTQEQYTEIVEYAQERYITIVPEIDMPGHTNAALASYAELNCDGVARELYTGIEVGFSTLCTDKELTYQFVDDVVREIAALTPGPWFHIGGDESHVTEHDDYVYFVDRVQDIVVKYGKQVVGWDEIANASLVEGATIQFWADIENTNMGVAKGAKVLMSPAARAYLDMKYDSTTHLGLHWAGYIEVDHAYTWDPADMVEGVRKENILGVEAPLWTETITNIDEMEYMLFPRLPGYAEIAWTSPALRDWETYRQRLADHGTRFEDLEIDYYRSPLVPWAE